MTQFVEECRREWRRLRVPDEIANEMAADLEADLHDAEADGLSAEEVLGSAVFDPRAFAASWADERGVIPPPAAAPSHERRTVVAAVIGALAIAALAAGIAILSTRHGSTEVAVAAPFRFRPAIGAFRLPKVQPREIPRFFFAPVRGKVWFPPKPIPVGLVRPGTDVQPVGWLLVALGLAGVLAAIVLSRSLPATPWRRASARA